MTNLRNYYHLILHLLSNHSIFDLLKHTMHYKYHHLIHNHHLICLIIIFFKLHLFKKYYQSDFHYSNLPLHHIHQLINYHFHQYYFHWMTNRHLPNCHLIYFHFFISKLHYNQIYFRIRQTFIDKIFKIQLNFILINI
jgi:hypothetical protein